MENKKFRNFSQIERAWVEAILSVDFFGKEIILKQLDSAQILRDYNIGYISLKINVNRSIEKVPFQIRVPIEMRATKKDDVPIIFLLHFVDGFVDELEIFNADSSPISDNIYIEKKDIIVDESLL